MKRLLGLTLAFLSAFVLTSSTPLWAHEGHDDADDDAASSAATGGHAERMKAFNAELGITADQQKKLDAIKQEQKGVMSTIMQKSKDLRTKLADQVKNKASDAELQATLSDLEVNHKNMRDEMEKFRQQREAILTPTQRAKAVLKMGDMRHGGMMKHHEMQKEMNGK